LPERNPAALQAFKKAGLFLLKNDSMRSTDQMLDGIDENVLICGHTHIPWAQKHEGKLALNPGSVGFPINSDPRAQYAVLTWHSGRWWTEHRAIPYDVSKTRAAFHESGLLEAGGGFARACLLSIETGHNVSAHFILYAHRVAAQAGFERNGTLPDDLWTHIETTFDWENAVSGH
jgi:hypothetical protein